MLGRDPVYISDGNGLSPTRSDKLSRKFSEFVGAVIPVTAAVILIIWAYVPDFWLNTLGRYIYPSRYWTVANPSYVMATIVLAIVCYTGLKLIATPPPNSLKSILDDCGNELLRDIISTYEDERVADPISYDGVNRFDDDVS